MMKWTSAVTSKYEKQGDSNHGNEIERQQDNELDDLPQGERRVNGLLGRLAQFFNWVIGIRVQSALLGNQRFESFVDHYGVEYVDEGLVHEECFEKQGYDSGAFSQYQDSAVHPCTSSLKDG